MTSINLRLLEAKRGGKISCDITICTLLERSRCARLQRPSVVNMSLCGDRERLPRTAMRRSVLHLEKNERVSSPSSQLSLGEMVSLSDSPNLLKVNIFHKY